MRHSQQTATIFHFNSHQRGRPSLKVEHPHFVKQTHLISWLRTKQIFHCLAAAAKQTVDPVSLVYRKLFFLVSYLQTEFFTPLNFCPLLIILSGFLGTRRGYVIMCFCNRSLRFCKSSLVIIILTLRKDLQKNIEHQHVNSL